MIRRWLEILGSCIFWVIYLSVTQHGLLSVCPSCTFSTPILLAALLVSPSRTALENEIIRKNEISALVPFLSFYLWLNSSARYLGPYSWSCLVLKVVPRDRILRKFKNFWSFLQDWKSYSQSISASTCAPRWKSVRRRTFKSLTRTKRKEKYSQNAESQWVNETLQFSQAGIMCVVSLIRNALTSLTRRKWHCNTLFLWKYNECSFKWTPNKQQGSLPFCNRQISHKWTKHQTYLNHWKTLRWALSQSSLKENHHFNATVP